MANSYVRVDRDQGFLLPPDMREWLGGDHLVWLVLEVVEGLDTSELHGLHPGGRGRRAYDPDMMLGLLLYAYSRGVRSSREIERLCEVDVAFRVLVANPEGQRPDHSTVARFRQSFRPVIEGLFGRVLVLCAEAGLVRLGTVAIDGTKMEASASMGANRDRSWMQREVQWWLDEAEETDRREDELFGEGRRGDELPDDLADPGTRRERIRRALEDLNGRAEVISEQEHARTQSVRETVQRREERAARRAAERARKEAEAAREGKKVPGRRPHPDGPKRLREARERLDVAVSEAARRATERTEQLRGNVTDPDSRVMRTRQGFIQGYNAQAAVTEDGAVLAADVTQDQNDVDQLRPMMDAATEMTGRIGRTIGIWLFDAGYWSEANARTVGDDGLIATTCTWKLTRRIEQDGHRSGPPPPDGTAAEKMEHRLLTENGHSLYAKRATTVEPVFGNIKQGGSRRFMQRGIDAVRTEWKLLCTVHNLTKLHRAITATP